MRFEIKKAAAMDAVILCVSCQKAFPLDPE